jgi:hypothetical protein
MAYHWLTVEAKFVRVGNSQEIQSIASGLAVIDPNERKPIAEMARRFVRDNQELIEKLAW